VKGRCPEPIDERAMFVKTERKNRIIVSEFQN
jgi:hypothetical protein